MKALVTSAVFAALLLAVSVPTLRAQHPSAAKAPEYRIAVVDISYVFKEHARFKQQMEAMKLRMKALDEQFTGQQKAIVEKQNARNQFKPNTQEWKKLDNEITRMKADLTVRADQEQKTLLQEEANMYYQTYLEVQDAIKMYATRYQIGLVLRFNGDKIDPSSRDDIIKGINQPIVYQDSIDITPDILALVNRSANAAAKAPPKAGGTVPR